MTIVNWPLNENRPFSKIASTRAHMYAAVGGAVGSLSGKLHGGANTRVMQMLKKINSVDAIDDYIKQEHFIWVAF
ncbi:MAG: hypothetical protein PF482_10200 [Desulfobacteraceae bacterium]|nr:hypothetical protein [Desulfobacteraceae bacterium]